MCGIFGYVRRREGALDPQEDERKLSAALKALWHRGPDDRGTFVAEAGEHRVGFAHVRLAILDLSPLGHQPMHTPDGRFSITYNGEVYNFRELRAELEQLGDTFVSQCDTEVVLKAYARWGAGALTRFRGMFALAIWDAAERSLFVARDRLGIKPVYYVEDRRGGLAFSSEVRALLAAGFAERSLSRRALTSYLAFGAVSGPEVILDGVRSLPPGHYLRWKDGVFTEREFWSIPLAPERDAIFADEARAIRPILQDAVRLRLIADVPIGVFLSGGVDSTAIVALATRASESPVHTFTVTFDEERYSEAAFAAEVAHHYGCDHHQVHLPASEAVGNFGRAIEALDQPTADGVNTYFVSKAAREAGLTVALSGLGGDELFAGYGYFRSFSRLASIARVSSELPTGVRRALGAAESIPAAPLQLRKLSMLLAGEGTSAATYAACRAMFTPEERRALLAPGVEEAGYLGITLPAGLEHVEQGSRRLSPVNAYSALELSNYTRHTLLRDTDVMSMAHAIEVRVPLLDHVLVERTMRIPGSLKLRASQNKPLLTAAVADLPSVAVNRPKMGFTLPYDAWFRGPLRPWMEDLLLADSVRRLGFLRHAAVERLWRSFLKGDRYTTHTRIWCLAALAGWCEANHVSHVTG